ncbi:MAG: 3-deoxy-manno-octulosonate cytidylyltransferase [Tunicatimonas sp.]
MSASTVVIIPARLASLRLPNKVLLDLHGKPMIQRVYEQAQQATTIAQVYVATDSTEIRDACARFTDRIIMTRADHPSGTDRLAEAAAELDTSVVINVQGDEPFIDPAVIDQLAACLHAADVPMASAAFRIRSVADFRDPALVKVVVDEQQRALYFSRAPVPYPRQLNLSGLQTLPDDFRAYGHLGIYAYRKDFLLHYASLPPTYLEQTERLEQLRVLENGYSLRIIEAPRPSLGIDTPEDLVKARELAESFFGD